MTSASCTSRKSRITTTPTSVSALENRVTMPSVTSWLSASTSLVIREISTPGRSPREEADRHRLQVGEDPLAQVLQRPLADPADEVGLRVGRGPVDQRRGDERRDDPVERRRGCSPDAVVDRQAGEVRGSQPRGGRGHEGHQHQDHARAVGAQQAEHPAHLAAALVLAAEDQPGRAQPAHSRATSSRSSRSRCR